MAREVAHLKVIVGASATVITPSVWIQKGNIAVARIADLTAAVHGLADQLDKLGGRADDCYSLVRLLRDAHARPTEELDRQLRGVA